MVVHGLVADPEALPDLLRCLAFRYELEDLDLAFGERLGEPGCVAELGEGGVGEVGGKRDRGFGDERPKRPGATLAPSPLAASST